MRTLKSGIIAMAAAFCLLHPAQRVMADTTVIQPSLGQPGYGYNAQPYVPQQGQGQGQNIYNNGYNAVQNAMLAQPNGQQNQGQQTTQIKYIYKGGVNDAHPLRPEELPQRIYHNCPCRDYSSDYPKLLVITVP